MAIGVSVRWNSLCLLGSALSDGVLNVVIRVQPDRGVELLVDDLRTGRWLVANHSMNHGFRELRDVLFDEDVDVVEFGVWGFFLHDI